MAEKRTRAANFKLPDDAGGVIELRNLKGGIVVVYFYPKDDTPACTLEARDFTCLADDFAAAGATVIGVSPDTAAKHARFKAKHGLTIRLAADEGGKTAAAYGAWGEKQMFGRKYMGVIRSTFLIDRAGRVVRAWRNVKTPGHAAEVLEAVKCLKK